MTKSNVIYFRQKKKRAMCRFLIAFLGIDGGQIIDQYHISFKITLRIILVHNSLSMKGSQGFQFKGNAQINIVVAILEPN